MDYVLGLPFAARRGGQLADAPLSFTLALGNETIAVSVNPSKTFGNSTGEDLRLDIERAVNQALTTAQTAVPDDVTVQFDEAGRIVFAASGNLPLGDTTEARSLIAAARRDGRLEADCTDMLLFFRLTLDGVDLEVWVDPAETSDNALPEDLRDDVQRAVDRALVRAGFNPGAIGRQSPYAAKNLSPKQWNKVMNASSISGCPK